MPLPEEFLPWKPTLDADAVATKTRPSLVKLPKEIFEKIPLHLDDPFAAALMLTCHDVEKNAAVREVKLPRSISILIYPHHGRWNPTTGGFFGVGLSNPKPGPHDSLRSCDRCPTDFTPSERPAPHGKVTLECTVWKDFGNGREWNYDAWWSQVERYLWSHRILWPAPGKGCCAPVFIASQGNIKRDSEKTSTREEG
ncbi:unnamed protein product [Diplocarpon coronariae]